MRRGIRANWHLAALRVPESDDDPFDMTQGTVIDLTEGVAKLNGRLDALCRAESHFHAGGIRCDLKQEQGMDCYECPEFTDDQNDSLASLCYVGRQQIDVLGKLKAVRTISAEFDEIVEGSGVAEALELAEAMA